MSRMLVSDFGSVVPDDIDELKLPAGRKTANVVASVVYNKPVIAVTHMYSAPHADWDSHQAILCLR